MPKIVDHHHYRQVLLSQCLDVIAEKGYTNITMRQIAAGLGVSTGTLYHYFPNKEQLFEQLVDYISNQDTSPAAIAPLKELPTRRDRLRAIFDYMAANEEYFLRQTLMLLDFSRQKSRADITQDQNLQQAGKRYESALMEILELDDPHVVMLIIHFIDGLMMRRLYQGDRINFRQQTEIMLAVVAAYCDRLTQSGELPTLDPAE